MSDPFAHGTPAGDYHTWVRPPSEPCPNCPCCSKLLCEVAIANDAAGEIASACHLVARGSSDYDLSLCPCSRNRPGALPLSGREQAIVDGWRQAAPQEGPHP